MLVDQNRYVGNDPVGHRCLNSASHEFAGYLICDWCLRMLYDEPWRIETPIVGGRLYQDRLIQETINEFTKRHNEK